MRLTWPALFNVFVSSKGHLTRRYTTPAMLSACIKCTCNTITQPPHKTSCLKYSLHELPISATLLLFLNIAIAIARRMWYGISILSIVSSMLQSKFVMIANVFCLSANKEYRIVLSFICEKTFPLLPSYIICSHVAFPSISISLIWENVQTAMLKKCDTANVQISGYPKIIFLTFSLFAVYKAILVFFVLV